MYKPQDSKTPPLFPELFPLGGSLNPSNRWVKLAALAPWDEMEEVYSRYFSPIGRPAKNARLVCGLLLVKWLEGYTDDKAVTELRENPYIQAFCGLGNFVTDEDILEAGLLSRARRKMGEEVFANFEAEITGLLAKESDLALKFPKIRDEKAGFFSALAEFFRRIAKGGGWRKK